MKIFSSLAIKAAYLELGTNVPAEWMGMADIRRRLQAGETPDGVIGSAALVDELIKAGTLASGSRVDLVKSGVGVAVRKGAPRPDVSSTQSLYAALRKAKSIVYSSGPSGVYLAELFRKNGLAEELKGRLTQAPPGELVGERVARGEMELCFQQMPELQQVAGLDIAGPLPAEIQTVTVFSGGIHAKAADAAGVRALFAFLRANSEVMRKHGMELA